MKISLFDGFFEFDCDWKAVIGIWDYCFRARIINDVRRKVDLLIHIN